MIQPKPVRLLEGTHVYLRPFNVEDAEIYFQLLFQAETRRLTGTQHSFTLEQIRRYAEAKGQDPTQVLLLIALKENDEVIGDIALQDIHPINRSANIRIMIASEKHQGKGYGTEAMKLMLEYGFGILNLHRIELNVFPFNPRAIHVYEKLGFKKEGVQREVLFYNHAWHDSVLMSMLAHEYRVKYQQTK
ncbi:GNAT family N-acetyltransferase [Staphylospora marina]|uniref:GNAT family N-acetyltransferase n=1 Tax=Staphylospora marina TaxID=2490858 RepID=UPI000F5BACE3|nr:GNAT family protein [Staphylospora marina]